MNKFIFLFLLLLFFINSLEVNMIGTVPTRGSKLSVGYDLYVSEDTLLKPFEVVLVPSDVKLELIYIYFRAYVLIVGRSSTYKKNIMVFPSVIDADYRGSLGCLVENLSNTDILVTKGSRLCQIIFSTSFPANFNVVEELSLTERDEKGFGSSGL